MSTHDENKRLHAIKLYELLRAIEFWDQHPYSNRLYYGDMVSDFVTRADIQAGADALSDAAGVVRAQPSDEPTDDGVLSGAAPYKIVQALIDELYRVAEQNDDRSCDYDVNAVVRMACAYVVENKPLTRSLTTQDDTVYEWPDPMREVPNIDSPFWLTFDPDPSHSSVPYRAGRDADQSKWLQQGRCHATREARDAHERALIAASGGQS